MSMSKSRYYSGSYPDGVLPDSVVRDQEQESIRATNVANWEALKVRLAVMPEAIQVLDQKMLLAGGDQNANKAQLAKWKEELAALQQVVIPDSAGKRGEFSPDEYIKRIQLLEESVQSGNKKMVTSRASIQFVLDTSDAELMRLKENYLNQKGELTRILPDLLVSALLRGKKEFADFLQKEMGASLVSDVSYEKTVVACYLEEVKVDPNNIASVNDYCAKALIHLNDLMQKNSKLNRGQAKENLEKNIINFLDNMNQNLERIKAGNPQAEAVIKNTMDKVRQSVLIAGGAVLSKADPYLHYSSSQSVDEVRSYSAKMLTQLDVLLRGAQRERELKSGQSEQKALLDHIQRMNSSFQEIKNKNSGNKEISEMIDNRMKDMRDAVFHSADGATLYKADQYLEFAKHAKIDGVRQMNPEKCDVEKRIFIEQLSNPNYVKDSYNKKVELHEGAQKAIMSQVKAIAATSQASQAIITKLIGDLEKIQNDKTIPLAKKTGVMLDLVVEAHNTIRMNKRVLNINTPSKPADMLAHCVIGQLGPFIAVEKRDKMQLYKDKGKMQLNTVSGFCGQEIELIAKLAEKNKSAPEKKAEDAVVQQTAPRMGGP